MSFYQKIFSLLIVGLFSLGIACGGSSSSSSNNDSGDAGSTNGSGSALTVADKVTVVDASESTSSNISALKFALSDIPLDAQYYTDESDVWANDISAESFDTVNEILCIMDQVGHEHMINQGWYNVQVNIGNCDSESDDPTAAAAEEQDQSSSSGAPEIEIYTAGFSRADESAQEFGNLWMHFGADEEGFEPAMLIEVNIIITESSDDAPPFGVFDLYFKAYPENEDGTAGDEVMMFGYLKSERQADDSLLLKFYVENSGEGFSFNERVAMTRDGDNSFGVMSGTESFDGDTFERNYQTANNEPYFARTDGNETVCQDRNNPDVITHNYGMYDFITGARIERNSGFSIKLEDGSHGWASYHGIHADNNQALNDGDIVTKEEWGEKETDPISYTVFKREGKLVKHTKKAMTLGEINGISLSRYACNEEGCNDYCSYWDAATQKFYDYGVRDYDTYQCVEYDSPTVVTFSEDDWSAHFWSESLGGSIEVNIRDDNGDLITPKNTDPVIYYVDETVTADATDVPTRLACASECPDPSNMNTDSIYFTKSTWDTEDNFEQLGQLVSPDKLVANEDYIQYTVTDLMLQHNGTDVVRTVDSDFGTWSGPLFTLGDVTKLQLKCDWKNENNIYGTCFWKARSELDVYWTWESGTDTWNQYTGLQDADGNFVTFDPPLSVKYKHSDGTTYQLQFEGHRNLHGIPGICMSWETGKEISCNEGGGDTRWIPQLTIPDGSTATDENSGATYLIKGLDKEQLMKIVDISLCEDVGLEFTLDEGDLPDAAEFEDFDLGEEPLVDEAPAVIEGELQ